MTWKIKRWQVVVGVLGAAVLLVGVCFVDSLRYPRIARSAYWRHPHLLVRATAARMFPGKGVSKKAVVAHASQLGYRNNLHVCLLYLPDSPTDDKTIRDRVFSLVGKRCPDSKEKLFWVVTPNYRGRIINDHMLAHEYRTGRLVSAEDTSRIGEFALE